MRTEKKFMRRRYAPLVTGCSLTCTTPESPLTQLYSGGEYQPNREGTTHHAAAGSADRLSVEAGGKYLL